LPSSGPYEPIASKINRGAKAALQELTRRGEALRLEFINTEGPHWLAELSALPRECAVVGSPLQASRYDEARKAGVTDHRVFFTFLPSLKAGDEGTLAWRFFPSPQDQIDALVVFATDTLNIRTYGAFYPADAFGERMTALLEQNLAARSIFLQKVSYVPDDATTWNSAAAVLLHPVIGPDGRTPVPQTAFEALFLPDSWKNMDRLTTSLLYNGEDRLVLLGTTLWEQGLSGRLIPNADKFFLAVFPGAWNADVAPPDLKTQASDFWVALGYDFTRFAVNLGFTWRPSAMEVSSKARSVQMTWSMAPIFWDTAGMAHQKLWLFQVTYMGMTPLNVESFEQNRSVVLQRASLRMQGLSVVDAQSNPLVPGSSMPTQNQIDAGWQKTAPQNQPAVLPLSPTPKPSYKLSLPQAR
jgi:hypothetical protein